MVKKPLLPVPTEHDEQVMLFKWASLMVKQGIYELDLLYAIPNGARTSMRTAVKLKAEGLKRGFPDIALPVARHGFHGLFIEVKRLRGGRISKDQRLWHERLIIQRHKVMLAVGWRDAALALCHYLDLPHSCIP